MIGLRVTPASLPPGADVSEVWIEDHEFEAWVRSGTVGPETMVWAGAATGGGWRRAEDLELFHLFRIETPEPPLPPLSLGDRLFPARGFSALETLLLANILAAALLLSLWRGDYAQELGSLMWRWHAQVADRSRWYLLLPTFFIHADAGHLFRNLVALVAAAAPVEVFFGRTRTWAAYLLTGMAGGVISFYGHGRPPLSVGASGAVFGLAGVTAAFLVRFYPRFSERQRWKTRRVYGPLFLLLVLPSLFHADYHAHGGGFVMGVLVGAFLPLDSRGKTLLGRGTRPPPPGAGSADAESGAGLDSGPGAGVDARAAGGTGPGGAEA